MHVLRFLQRRWFLCALLILLPLGMRIGFHARPETAAKVPVHLIEWATGILTATILFLMSVTLEGRKLVESFRAPGPVLWAVTVNFILIPLGAIGLLRLQQTNDFAVGLMIAASVPSTLATASVWTRKAGGNDAIALLVTILTNAICFLVTPLWLKFGCGDSVELETVKMITKLFFTALVPIGFGQLFRFWPAFRSFADRAKIGFGAVAQVLILAIVFWAAVQGGAKLSSKTPGSSHVFAILPIAVVWGSCIALHLTALFIAWTGGRSFGFRREDIVGTMFSGSQKTLPLGLFIAAGLASKGLPFAAIPMLMFHGSQLILDTLFVDPLQRWVTAETSPATTEPMG